jgi:hypothetical protein
MRVDGATLGDQWFSLHPLQGRTGSAGTTWERELITLCGSVCLPFLIPAKFGAKTLE